MPKNDKVAVISELANRNSNRIAKLLDGYERAGYEAIKKAFRDAYPELDNAADEMLLHFLAFFAIKAEPGMGTKPSKDDIIRLEYALGRIQGIQKQLGVRRDVRGKPRDSDAVMAMLAKYQAMARDGKVMPPPPPPPVEGTIIDAKVEPPDGIGEPEKKPKNQGGGT